MSEIYHTPQEAIDVVLAQPEMDAVQRLAEDGSPHPDGRRLNADTTEATSPARSIPDTMSNCECAYVLANLARRLANDGKVSPDEIEAMKMAAHRVSTRYWHKVRNDLRRRAARRLAEDGSPHPDGTAASPGGPGCPGCPGEEAAQ